MADKKLRIDLNRGVRMSKDPVTSLQVYMYLDHPGEYLTSLAQPVAENIAARAGYEIEKFRREKLKKEKLAEFQKQLDAEFGNKDEQEVLAQGNGYKMIAIGGHGMAMVLDENGNALTATALPQATARSLYNSLAGVEDEKPAKKGKVKPMEEDDE